MPPATARGYHGAHRGAIIDPVIGDDWSLRSRRVVTPEGVRPARVTIRDGRIAEISESGDPVTFDFGDAAVLPGGVDPHVHCDEPGRTDWEGFASATRAAAAGGITTLIDMPLNSVPATVDASALAAKRRAADGRCSVDVGFWGGVVPENAPELDGLWRDGVLGFKCFLVPSGVPEFGAVGARELAAALPILARLGAPLLVHAEAPELLLPGPGGGSRQYSTYLRSRPPEAEAAAIAQVAAAALRHGVSVHIVHVSSAAGVAEVARARALGAAVTAETCPHYLTFAAEEIPDGATLYKCAPPIREASARQALWDALESGTLDFIASDHSPSPPAGKALESGDFFAAWGGVSSLQLSLRAAWTGANARGHDLGTLARWMSTAPARFAGLAGRKGAIAVGCDADLVVFDPESCDGVDAGRLEHRHKITPYAGRILRGRVLRTYLRGELIYDGAQFPVPPRGVLLDRSASGEAATRNA